MQWIGWITAILGLWLICAPFFLGYNDTTGALWNDITIGILTAGLGTWVAIVLRRK